MEIANVQKALFKKKYFSSSHFGGRKRHRKESARTAEKGVLASTCSFLERLPWPGDRPSISLKLATQLRSTQRSLGTK